MYLPTIEELQYNIVIYSKTSRQYETMHSAPLSKAHDALNRMPLHGTIRASFPYYYEFKACDAYLLLYTNSGQGRFQAGETVVSLLPDTLLFFRCLTDYKLELSDAGEWHYHFLYVSGAMIAPYYDAYTETGSFLYTLPSISSVPFDIERIFYLYTTRESEKRYDFLLSNLLTGLLTTILLEQDSHIYSTAQLPPHLALIKNRFDVEYMQAFSLDELARDAHISKYKLIRDFTAHLDISPINYLIHVRIQNAKRLLTSTCDPVSEIAAAVGIENMNHFIYLFKKSEGMTPGAYRKACYGQKRNLIE